jgi:hypothetical protein
METGNVRNAFSGLVDDVRQLTQQRNELTVALHSLLAVMINDEAYLRATARPGESPANCGARLVREARDILKRCK